jgi:hypothetical protein
MRFSDVKKTRGPWEVRQPLVDEADTYTSTNVPEISGSLVIVTI